MSLKQAVTLIRSSGIWYPLKIFFADPKKAFYITIPAALIYFILSIYAQKITVEVLDDSIIISLLIMLVPFLLFYATRTRHIRAIEESVPAVSYTHLTLPTIYA